MPNSHEMNNHISTLHAQLTNQIVDINVGQNYDLLVLQIDDNKGLKQDIIIKSKNTNNLKCSFESFSYNKFSKKKNISNGDLFLTKPQKILWQYIQPVAYYISIEEKGAKTNQFGFEQEYEVGIEFDKLNILIVKYYNGSIFDINKYDYSYYQNKETYILRLTPISKTKNTNITNIELSVNSIDMGLIGVRFKYSNNVVSNYVFSDRIINWR